MRKVPIILNSKLNNTILENRNESFYEYNKNIASDLHMVIMHEHFNYLNLLDLNKLLVYITTSLFYTSRTKCLFLLYGNGSSTDELGNRILQTAWSNKMLDSILVGIENGKKLKKKIAMTTFLMFSKPNLIETQALLCFPIN